MGTLDRIIRFALAATFLYLYYVSYSMYSEVSSDIWGLGFFLLGCGLTLTGIFGFCPVYAPFGLCSTKNAKSTRP